MSAHCADTSAVGGKLAGRSPLVHYAAGVEEEDVSKAARPIHRPHCMSQPPEFGGDKMSDDRRRAGDVEPSNPLLNRAITNGHALVLA